MSHEPINHPFVYSDEVPEACAICGSERFLDHYWKCEHMIGNGDKTCGFCRAEEGMTPLKRKGTTRR